MFDSSELAMRKVTMLGLLAVLAVGTGTMSAFADSMTSPLHQWKQGVPTEEIQCSDDRVLMQTLQGRPACVTEKTSWKMLDRGWELVPITSTYDVQGKKFHYAISNGTVLEMRYDVDLPHDLSVSLDDVGLDSVLTVDAPYESPFPLMTSENKDEFFLLADGGEVPSSVDVIYQCYDYQTLRIKLPPNVKLAEIITSYPMTSDLRSWGHDHKYNLTIPLLELDETCVSLDKRGYKYASPA